MLTALVAWSAIITTASAQIGSDRYAAIVTEARSGNVLIAASPDEQRYPASLTKMMTVYLAFDALRDGRTTLGSTVRVSQEAAAMPPSRLGLVPGMTLTVEEAILALVTKSANDAAAALGEHLGGTEQRFAQMMTLRARALGMTRTTFRNASGLPDLDQVSTARDMALLGRRLMQDFPDRYATFAAPHFVFRGRTHWNHNRLLQEYEGTDGIKTGYVNDSGFNLVASAQRDGVRLVASVFGGRTGRERDRHMMALLDQGFASLGVAPRAPMWVPPGGPVEAPQFMARRPTGRGLAGILAQAQAATVGRGRLARTAASPPPGRQVAARPAAAPAQARQGPARSVTARTVVTTRPTRSAARIEQGDTSGRGGAERPARTVRKPAQPAPSVAAKAAPQRPTAATSRDRRPAG